MSDFWFTFIVTSLMTILRQAVKNPAKAEALKGKLLNIRDTINAMYPQD